MYKYLFRGGRNPLSKFVRKQYKNYKCEEYAYISSFLSHVNGKIKNNKDFNPEQLEKSMQETYIEVNALEKEEQIQLSNNNHLEQIFYMFNELRKASQNERIILNKRYEELSDITEIIDPDKFPIFSLIEVIDERDIVSIWEYKPEIFEKVKKRMGFGLNVKQSSLEHHEAGDGVFLSIHPESKKQKISRGTLLGLCPGLMYDSITDFEEIMNKTRKREFDQYLFRYDGTVLDFTQKIYYPNELGLSMTEIQLNIIERAAESQQNILFNVYGEKINPYALAHKINHCPKDTPPNVVLLDIYIPLFFFGENFLKFLPNIILTRMEKKAKGSTLKLNSMDILNKPQQFMRTIGIFALREIENDEELFLNYFDSNMFEIDTIRDWLVKPPPVSPFYTKMEFETEFTLVARIVDSFLFKKYASVYEKFEKKVSHDINRHEFEEVNYFQNLIDGKQKK